MIRHSAFLACYFCVSFIFAESRTAIQIVSASYGKDDKTCNARSYVAQKCEGRSRCKVLASNSICGDPNPLVVKQLDVLYRCDRGSVKNATAMEYLLIELTCDGDPKLFLTEVSGKAPHGQPTMALQPNCQQQELQEGPDKTSNPHAACIRLCADVPPNAKLKRVYGFAKELTMETYLPCQIDTDGTFYPDRYCNIESSAFYPHYQTVTESAGTKVCWTFRNWSLHQEREAKLIVQYEK